MINLAFSRFEEIQDEEESPKNLKRPREDVMDVDEHEEKLSKSQKKKLAKKLKAADGKAVPAPTPEKAEDEKKVEKKEKKKDKAEKKEKSEQKDGEKKEKVDKKAERTLEGDVKVRDASIGSGKMAKKGDKLQIRYIGKFLDGKIFDKNVKGKPVCYNCRVHGFTINSISSSPSRLDKVMSSKVGQLTLYTRCGEFTSVQVGTLELPGCKSEENAKL